MGLGRELRVRGAALWPGLHPGLWNSRLVHPKALAGYLGVGQGKQACGSSVTCLRGGTTGLLGACLNSEKKNASQREEGQRTQGRGILTVPGWQRKLTSSRTWATRTAKDRLAWMW